MKVSIIKSNNIKELILSSEVIGNYLLTDVIDRKEEQLTYIEAINNKWVMKSTDETKIILNNAFVDSVELKLYEYYVLEKNEQRILIYTSPVYDNTVKMIQVKEEKITIGNSEKDTIVYGLEFLSPEFVTLIHKNDIWELKKGNSDNAVFINKDGLLNNGIILKNGDEIFIYGLTIVVLSNHLIINNPRNLVSYNSINFVDEHISMEKNDDETIIKEEDYYTDDDYFLRSPRIRRKIETYEIKIDQPPSPEPESDQSILLTAVPMLMMGVTSIVTLLNTVLRLVKKETTLSKTWPSLIISAVMLISTLIWPNIARRIKEASRKRKEKNKKDRYRKYLEKKKLEIKSESKKQIEILKENLISCEECYDIIINKKRTLWERKIGQQDFLNLKMGRGNIPADIEFSAPEEQFSIVDDELKEEAITLVNSSEILNDVPIEYSFLDNNITALMGQREKIYPFMKNNILQMIAFHGYDELKIVIFTNEKNKEKWKYVKDLPHCWNDTKKVRFYAETKDERNELSEMLNKEFFYRKYQEDENNVIELNLDYKNFPYYFVIITDCIEETRNLEIFQNVLNQQLNIGYSLIILENKISRLPNQCTNFVSIGSSSSVISKIDLETNRTKTFNDEIVYGLDMDKCAEVLSNIPIKLKENSSQLTTSLGFLEMFEVGNVEQLNIYNRWKNNDPTKTLKAEIGINENGDRIFLDLHEKYHGPHGLVAGMTGSGKSEFIITYILSMAVNYSPDEVSFILIDYKGGGLAGAFKNIKKGLVLPHLAGVITNLDKSEINRTLVSINSELKRRQIIFNQARDDLGESTIDIYKYQRLYREGKLDAPMPHLFIISDEFAELKSQQPEFMDDLISAARIGRSLGVHLVLATQKPSGVVNGQIWSNSKFKVCLKVQDKSDSTEMIRVPDAAALKNAGRFYLQVGFNELFILGQSAWCGTPYIPRDLIKKKSDKSINFINNLGFITKTGLIEKEKSEKKESQGEELVNVLSTIVEIAKVENKKVKKLWLDSIPEYIYEDELEKKYNFVKENYKVTAILGELDDPSNQKQELLTLPLFETGNTIVYSSYGSDLEGLLISFTYSICKNYSVDEVNLYIGDYGSESLRSLESFPQIGDMVFIDDSEKLFNLFKELNNIIEERKKLFSDYGGDYNIYCKNSGNKLPLIITVINNYDVFLENYNVYDDEVLQLSRDGQRYGVIFILTCTSPNVIRRRIKQNFSNEFCLRFINEDDYSIVLGSMKGKCLAEFQGRGFAHKEDIYEFQTSLICEDDVVVEKVKDISSIILQNYNKKAPRIPVLPEIVTLNNVVDKLSGISSVPLGIEKKSLEVNKLDFVTNPCLLISSQNINNGLNLLEMLILEFKMIENTAVILLDAEKLYENKELNITAYLNEKFNEGIPKIIEYSKANLNINIVIIIPGIEKMINKVEKDVISNLINEFSQSDNIKLVVFDTDKKLKKIEIESWYRKITDSSTNYWIGDGIGDQMIFRLALLGKETKEEISNSYAWNVFGNTIKLVKLVETIEITGDNNEG